MGVIHRPSAHGVLARLTGTLPELSSSKVDPSPHNDSSQLPLSVSPSSTESLGTELPSFLPTHKQTEIPQKKFGRRTRNAPSSWDHDGFSHLEINGQGDGTLAVLLEHAH